MPEITMSKKYLHPMFTAASFIIDKTHRQAKFALVDKENVNGILFSHIKKEIPTFATTWINLEELC